MKFIFLDIDGTIYENNMGITKETIEAIKLARKKGNKVFVCTGRPKCEVMEEITSIEFDGFIYCSGCQIEIDGKDLFLSEIPSSSFDDLISVFKKNDIGFMIQSVEKCFLNEKGKQILNKVFFSKFTNSELKRFNSPENNIYRNMDEFNLEEHKILKIVLFAKELKTLEKIKEHYKSEYDLIIYDIKKAQEASVVNGELLQSKINKATGIEKVLEHFGGSQKDTICFGDSRNDLEMIQFCEIGICMENGEEILKEIATEVCPSIHENGVSKTFKKLNLI